MSVTLFSESESVMGLWVDFKVDMKPLHGSVLWNIEIWAYLEGNPNFPISYT